MGDGDLGLGGDQRGIVNRLVRGWVADGSLLADVIVESELGDSKSRDLGDSGEPLGEMT